MSLSTMVTSKHVIVRKFCTRRLYIQCAKDMQKQAKMYKAGMVPTMCNRPFSDGNLGKTKQLLVHFAPLVQSSTWRWHWWCWGWWGWWRWRIYFMSINCLSRFFFCQPWILIKDTKYRWYFSWKSWQPWSRLLWMFGVSPEFIWVSHRYAPHPFSIMRCKREEEKDDDDGDEGDDESEGDEDYDDEMQERWGKGWCSNCKSLPFFYFLTFKKADCSIFALLVGRSVGWLVGWSTSPLIFLNIYRPKSPLLTQYHLIPINTKLYWPSATKYQPVPPSSDPVPPSTNKYRSLLTQ